MKNFSKFVIVIGTLFVVSCQNNVIEEPYVATENVRKEVVKSVRSYDEALEIAEKAINMFENNTRATRSRTIKRDEGQTVMRPATRGNATEEEPIMYIFNNENNDGFTIVAASKNQQPLIAVTEKGNYTYGEPTGVEPFDLYIENIATQLMSSFEPKPLPDRPITPYPYTKSDTVNYTYSKVDAMLTTKWGQSGIYGNLCPNGLSGCTNTAAVQIMAYHQSPSMLIKTYLGINSYEVISIDWNNILLHTEGIGTYSSSLGKYVCNCGCNYEQISIIMREIGYRANTDYRVDDPTTPNNELGSAAGELEIRNVFYLLGYGNPIHVEGITFADYQDVIYENLDNDMPMYVSGFQSGGGGHAWVIDGYEHESFQVDYYKLKTDYNLTLNPNPEYEYDYTDEYESNLLHFNWGWDGNCDGWFAFGCFVPKDGIEYDDDSESNSLTYNYNLWINLVYNIQPN